MKDPVTSQYYGAPKEIWINYVSHNFKQNPFSPAGFDVTLQWFQKTPTRLPESIMYYFSPTNPGRDMGNPDFKWRVSKLGHLVDPGNVVQNGSQYLHGMYLNDLQWSLNLSGHLRSEAVCPYN